MIAQIIVGILTSIFGLIIIVFKGAFSRYLFRYGGGSLGAPSLEQKHGKEGGEKITFYIGLFGFLLGIIMAFLAFFGVIIPGL